MHGFVRSCVYRHKPETGRGELAECTESALFIRSRTHPCPVRFRNLLGQWLRASTGLSFSARRDIGPSELSHLSRQAGVVAAGPGRAETQSESLERPYGGEWGLPTGALQ